MIPPPPRSTLFPYTTLFRSINRNAYGSRVRRGSRAAGTARSDVSVENIQSFMKNAARSLFRSGDRGSTNWRSEEHTSELQSHSDLVCRLLLEKKKKITKNNK